VGITAAVHGNELNGVPCIHHVITDIDVHRLRGTVVAVPCMNVVGYLRFTREFSDGKDLNRLFPGEEVGTASQVYAWNLVQKIVDRFHYLIDLHTASFGRVNSYYVRSDMNDAVSAALAKLQQPQIILHNSGQDGKPLDCSRARPRLSTYPVVSCIKENLLGTLRSAAMARGIKAITVEIGNPQLFQNQYVQWSYMGVMRILAYLSMFTPEITEPTPLPPNTIVCSKGFWIYTKTGGVLEVYPGVNTFLRKGDLIARIKNIFGNIVDEIFAPSHGIVSLEQQAD
jgi:predicted deacylase